MLSEREILFVRVFKLGFRKKRRLLTSEECGWVEARALQVQEQHKQTDGGSGLMCGIASSKARLERIILFFF